MRFKLMLVALGMSLAGPAAAQNMMVDESGIATFNETVRAFDFSPRYTAKQVLIRLRAVCNSDNRYDKKRCAAGMAILRDAHSEMQYRRAASAVVTD